MISHRLMKVGIVAALALAGMQGSALAARYAAPGGNALGLTCNNPGDPCTLSRAV